MNDEFLVEQVTNLLFKTGDFGTDLAARNIQRARDHGLAGYGAYRAACGLSEPGDLCSWDDDRPDEIPEDRWEDLRAVYEEGGNSPADMDLFTAGLAESPEEEAGGAVVGPTFACIIGRQFRALRDGDRFFFTHGFVGVSKIKKHFFKSKSLSDSRDLCYIFFLVKNTINCLFCCVHKRTVQM